MPFGESHSQWLPSVPASGEYILLRSRVPDQGALHGKRRTRLFWTISNCVARLSTSPDLEMPSLYMMSNSAVRKGGATLFLTTLTCAIANDFRADFDGLNAPHVEPNGGVKFDRLTAGGGFRIAEHHADLLAQSIGKDYSGFRLVIVPGKFA